MQECSPAISECRDGQRNGQHTGGFQIGFWPGYVKHLAVLIPTYAATFFQLPFARSAKQTKYKPATSPWKIWKNSRNALHTFSCEMRILRMGDHPQQPKVGHKISLGSGVTWQTHRPLKIYGQQNANISFIKPKTLLKYATRGGTRFFLTLLH